MTGKGWIAAGDSIVGNEVHTLNGDVGTVTAFKLEKLDKPIPVYNIEVEGFHSYFVGDGVLVHNKCRGRKSVNSEDKANDIPSIYEGTFPEDHHKSPTQAVLDVMERVGGITNPPKGPKTDYNELLKYFTRHFVWGKK